jgi:hypothetical protein
VITSIVDTFSGLPLHVLVVHAAVILTPLAAVFALALVRPSWRMRLRWPAAIAVLAAWLLVWLARASGLALATAVSSQLQGTPAGKAVAKHMAFANQLNQVLFALVVVLVVFALLLPRLPRAAGTVGAVVIAVLALMVVGLVARTGEQGSRAAWNPDGSQSFQVK